MADSKISALTAIATITAADDVLPIVDASAGTTKKISVAQLVTEATSSVLGKSVIGYWPAASIKPSVTNGCAPLAWDESTTNDVMVGYLAFDAAAIEYAQFSFKAPTGLSETTLTAYFEWTEASGASSHDCVWQIEIQAQGDADTVDSAWGAAVTVTDTGTSGTRRFSAETSAITPGGTWAAGDEIIVRVSRKATDGSDTLNVDAKLIGVALLATYSTFVEA